MNAVGAALTDDAAHAAPGVAADVRRLRGLLAAIRGQARWWIWVESLALVGLALAGFFWGSLALDWWLEPPREARATAVAAIGLLIAAVVVRKLWSRLGTRLGDESLAVVVERTHPGFRDSLSTAIELADARPDDVDAGLLARTAAEARAMIGEVRPERIFRRRELALLAFGAAAAVASVLALAVARPAVAGLWVRRVPLLGDEAWPRRVRLAIEGFPGGVLKIARGSDVDVVVRASGAAGPPELVDLRWRSAARGGSPGAWHVDRMGARGGLTAEGQSFGHVLKGVGEPVELEVRGGDARLRGLRIEVLEPPALAELRIGVTLPEYLGGGTRALPPTRVVQAPRGSAVEIVCTASKPLSAATMTAVPVGGAAAGRGAGAGPPAATAAVPADDVVIASLAAEGDGRPAIRSITGRLDALDADRAVVVRFTDTDGLVNRDPVTFVLAATPDEPPQVGVALRGISTAVTPRARVPLVGTISDDHGLAAARVVVGGGEGNERELPVARLQPGTTLVELTAAAPEIVPLEQLGLAVGGKVELRLAATDGCGLPGGANQGASDTWSLDVVSPEALVAMLEAREIILRRRYESVVADFTQARDRLAAPAPADAAPGEGAGLDGAAGEGISEAAGMGDAAARAGGETGELAEAFRAIRLEFENNQLLSPELDSRLGAQIADPLAALAAKELPALAAAGRRGAARPELLRDADAVLTKMRAILDKMMELESFNEVVELLRGLIRAQEEIRADTLEQQKRRAREALGK